MKKEELSLLLFLETCAVDYGGRVDSRRMNKEDFAIVDEWKKSSYVLFGRIYSKDITDSSHWVELSNVAWNDAHAERKARFNRINEKRTWSKTEEARQDNIEEKQASAQQPKLNILKTGC
jgi:hypothetical protein